MEGTEQTRERVKLEAALPPPTHRCTRAHVSTPPHTDTPTHPHPSSTLCETFNHGSSQPPAAKWTRTPEPGGMAPPHPMTPRHSARPFPCPYPGHALMKENVAKPGRWCSHPVWGAVAQRTVSPHKGTSRASGPRGWRHAAGAPTSPLAGQHCACTCVGWPVRWRETQRGRGSLTTLRRKTKLASGPHSHSLERHSD